MSRRDREREFKKQYIAETAYRLFSGSSYEAVTVEEIAREAEFGKGTLYQFFESKEDLLAYILEESLTKLCTEIESQCATEVEPRQALSRLITLQYRFYNDYAHLFLSFMRRKLDGILNPRISERVRHINEGKRLLAAQVLERGIREKLIIPADHLKLARAMECIVIGFVISGVEIDGAAGDPEKDLELIRLVFSKGIFLHNGGEQSGADASKRSGPEFEQWRH